MHLYFGLIGAIPCIRNRPSPCLHKKYSELLLSHHTFYNELCKYLPDKNHFRFIFLLNSFSVWICQRLLRVMERRGLADVAYSEELLLVHHLGNAVPVDGKYIHL